jgi:glycerate-2-kinase
MFINKDELLDVEDNTTRANILTVLQAAVDAVEPYKCVKDTMQVSDDGILTIGADKFILDDFDHIFVIGGGKACVPMAKAVVELLGEHVVEGYLNGLEATKIGKIQCTCASHPIPDDAGKEGAEKMFALAERASAPDLILCLISGGGSALMPLPERGISLQDKMAVTKLLLNSGATIHEINAVRKHLSRLKGGKLARAAYPAKVVSLILSDVVGDPIDSIASGPTAPDPTTYDDVIAILQKYELRDKVPKGVREIIDAKLMETPKPGDKIFENVTNIIIGNNKKAVAAANAKARDLGYNTLILTTFLEGEAREVGITLLSIAREILTYDVPVRKPAMIIAGGETTVTVTGSGFGGRNQELVLSALRKLPRSITVASMGTDGVDGRSSAAGAIGDRYVVEIARAQNLNMNSYLKNNDSYSFFRKVNGLLITGPTGTNVADIALIVVE